MGTRAVRGLRTMRADLRRIRGGGRSAADDADSHGAAGQWPVACPKRATLRESGCTFCGQCVMVCPAGALTAPGPEGARWLAARREMHSPPRQLLPPNPREHRFAIPADLERIPSEAGVLTFYDASDEVLRIAGVEDLRQGWSGYYLNPPRRRRRASASSSSLCIRNGRRSCWPSTPGSMDISQGKRPGDDLFAGDVPA